MNNSSFYITFAVAWTFIEATIALSGVQEWNTAILRSIFVVLFGGAILVHVRSNLRQSKKKLSGDNLNKRVLKSIENGFKYLVKENANKNGQRMRLSPSIMESATTIGALSLASTVVHKDSFVEQRTIEWLLGSLKKQFRDQVPVKYFECSRCDNGNVCNVAYFDYLSHFYYAKNTSLYNKFVDEFQFLGEILASRISCTRSKCGWKLFDQGEYDVLATSTNLILCSVLGSLSESQEKRAIKLLLALQVKSGPKKGGWNRIITDSRWCAGNLEIITAHRAIECLAIYKNKYSEFSSEIDAAIANAVTYLKSCQGSEEPVNYEHQMGIDDVELLRGTGHIVQAMVKAEKHDEFLVDKINILIHSQQKNGAFVGQSGYLDGQREIRNKTDLTAFIVRTLCLYYQKYA